MEATEHRTNFKSRRLDDVTTSHGTMTTSRTDGPLFLGARSLFGREPDVCLQKGTNGLELLEEGAKKVEWSPTIGQTDVGILHK